MNTQPEDSNKNEITRKRKATDEGINNPDPDPDQDQEKDNDVLDTSLSLRPASRPHGAIPDVDTSAVQSHPQPPLQISSSHSHPQSLYTSPSIAKTPLTEASTSSSSSSSSRRRTSLPNPTHVLMAYGKSETIPAPYPWATTQRATVHNLTYLLSRDMHTISGQVICRKCKSKYEVDYELMGKFSEVRAFIAEIKDSELVWAPGRWMTPDLPTCKFCQVGRAKPVITDKKREINWLFLLLGQLLGCCTLVQLKYFCKHSMIPRTSCKQRVVLLTYFGLCKQLDPDGPFDPPEYMK